MSDAATTEAAPAVDNGTPVIPNGAESGQSPMSSWGFKDVYATESAEAAPAEPAKEETAAAVTPSTSETAKDAPTPATAELPEDVKAQLAEYQKLKPFAQTVEQLRAMQLENDDAIAARRAQMEQQAGQQARLKSVEDNLRTQVNDGVLTPEAANDEWHRQYAAITSQEAQNRQSEEIQQLRAQLQGQQIDASLNAVYAQYPEIKANGAEPLVDAYVRGGMMTAEQAGALMSQVLIARGERAVADYVAKQNSNAAAAPVVGNGNGAGQTGKANSQPLNENSSFLDLFKLGRQYQPAK